MSVVNADGSGLRGLTDHPGSIVSTLDSSWSPDGSRIVYAPIVDRNAAIYVMNADGSGARRLTTDTAPDGKKIAFESFRDGRLEIYVMNADGSNQVSVTKGSGGSSPSWWPH